MDLLLERNTLSRILGDKRYALSLASLERRKTIRIRLINAFVGYELARTRVDIIVPHFARKRVTRFVRKNLQVIV